MSKDVNIKIEELVLTSGATTVCCPLTAAVASAWNTLAAKTQGGARKEDYALIFHPNMAAKFNLAEGSYYQELLVWTSSLLEDTAVLYLVKRNFINLQDLTADIF